MKTKRMKIIVSLALFASAAEAADMAVVKCSVSGPNIIVTQASATGATVNTNADCAGEIDDLLDAGFTLRHTTTGGTSIVFFTLTR